MRRRGIVALMVAQVLLVGTGAIAATFIAADWGFAVCVSGLAVSSACWIGAWLASRPSGHSAAITLWRLALGESVKVVMILLAIGWLLARTEFKPLGVLAGLVLALLGYALSFALMKR